MDALLGELSALGAASCWVLTAMVFTEAGRRIGATWVNVIRLWLAVAILFVVHAAVFGSFWPSVPTIGWWYLGVSGVIGLAIGDQFLFRALIDAGPRLSTLMMTVAPAVTAIIAWPVLDQPLGWLAMSGMVLTLGGIAWVVCERRDDVGGRTYPNPRRGILFGMLGGVGQAVGLVLAKLGMGDVADGTAVDPWSATLVRMIFGTLSASLLVAVLVRTGTIDRGTRSPEAARGRRFTVPLLILLGAIFGPVLGVWLSLVSVDRIDAGVAATLMSLSPVFILPVARIVEHEHIGLRAVLGAVLAVLGVGVLVASGDGSDGVSPPDDEVMSVERSSASITSRVDSDRTDSLASDPTSRPF